MTTTTIDCSHWLYWIVDSKGNKEVDLGPSRHTDCLVGWLVGWSTDNKIDKRGRLHEDGKQTDLAKLAAACLLSTVVVLTMMLSLLFHRATKMTCDGGPHLIHKI